MKLLNHFNHVPDLLIVDEADLDRHPFPCKKDEPKDEQEDCYFCGICKTLIPIEEYLTHRH